MPSLHNILIRNCDTYPKQNQKSQAREERAIKREKREIGFNFRVNFNLG
jgi:hypothetical protein